MRKSERTMQQLDPLAAGTSWDVALMFSLTTVGFAYVASFMTIRSSDSPGFIIAALLCLTAAAIVHIWSAMPRHAPYTRLNYGFFVILAISAAAFQIAGDSADEHSMFFEWGPIALALLFASASGYRSLPDQYLAGFAAVATLFIVLSLDNLRHPQSFGMFYYSAAGVSLLGIVVLGQASYTFKASRILMAWQKTVDETAVEPGLVNSVDILGTQILETREFLVGILSRGRVSEADTVRARELAGTIRSELVLLADQTWVELSGCVLHDPEKVLGEFDLSAQSAISALVSGLTDAGVENLQISLRSEPDTTRLSCVIQGTESPESLSAGKLRTHLSSFLRVMYVVFEDVRFINNHGQVNVMFYYAQ